MKKGLSEVGFEPTPSIEDQNACSHLMAKEILESGALDRSAILTWKKVNLKNINFKCKISRIDFLDYFYDVDVGGNQDCYQIY